MTLTAVLFAGGLSRRMGADKATLKISGEPLWSRQIKILRELQPQSILVSARERPVWCPPEIESVLDVSPSCGPLSGLVSALRHLQTSHLLALAIDLPQMTASELRKLWAMARPGCGVIPMNGENFEPLCAIYPTEAAAIATDALSSGDFSLQNFSRMLLNQNHAQKYWLDEREKTLFLNMNAPADLSVVRPSA